MDIVIKDWLRNHQTLGVNLFGIKLQYIFIYLNIWWKCTKDMPAKEPKKTEPSEGATSSAQNSSGNTSVQFMGWSASNAERKLEFNTPRQVMESMKLKEEMSEVEQALLQVCATPGLAFCLVEQLTSSCSNCISLGFASAGVRNTWFLFGNLQFTCSSWLFGFSSVKLAASPSDLRRSVLVHLKDQAKYGSDAEGISWDTYPDMQPHIWG